ncbi:acetyltransferase (GNAT) family protein [mine drainage metagenome]|uniref:Acetyltransferase (GNAT) family protein n=1 Tax=mine drainage metagenome TaxID=410659 RepID=A0A1J5QIL4_9ZZZZ
MTEGLVFEPVDLRHAERLFQALDFDAVYVYLTTPRPKNFSEVLTWIKRVGSRSDSESGEVWLNFVMLLDGEVVGRLQATVNVPSAEIAYLLNPGYSGKGYATTGTLWLLDHLFQEYGVTQFWATTDPGNAKSIALLKRCGFKETSLPAEGLRSYDDGDTVFGLRRFG